MKKLLLMAGVLALVACGERQAEAPPAGETTGEMAPAAAPMDTAMSHDTGMTHSDTAMARDTAK
jgi:hypothetical protein